jgi:hypothetical protein
MKDQLEIFRKMLDERNWPRFDIIHQGRLYRWISDDPDEECFVEVFLSEGRFQ